MSGLHWDVIIVGGGHAGCEAAAAAARVGARALLLTHRLETIGEMSCNPAIGGLGKGHLVREVDALGGLMGRAADAAGIQFRLLNRSKGPAVRGPRAQIDRALYRTAVQQALAGMEGMEMRAGAVEDLLIEAGRIAGVTTADGSTLRAEAVVLTTGTFLGGVILRGEQRISAGRHDDAAANGLARRLRGLDLAIGRLKTGTPPRLARRSVDFSVMEMQAGDDVPAAFSYLTRTIDTPQVECGVTYTNAQTHRVISDHLDESAVYGGRATGIGPRYCPSIEDKVVRFPDRESHQVFLEPEGLPGTPDGELIYPNGVSTSIGEAAQLAFLRTMRGLEQVEVQRFGYAIEYDFVDPRELDDGLQVRRLPGLYFAGQINGTTGYEEAAAQGLVAGLNAARAVAGRPAAVFGRAEAYIGVMIDDLVTRGVTEPYRMFTSRAEFRLALRADNADLRLTAKGDALGLIGSERRDLFFQKRKALQQAREQVNGLSVTPEAAITAGFSVSRDGQRRSFMQLLAQPGASVARLSEIWPEAAGWAGEVAEQVEIEARYAGYLARQEAEVAAFAEDEALILPDGLDYAVIGGLSTEAREKLCAVRPRSLGQAGRIEGVTPGALTALLPHVRRQAA